MANFVPGIDIVAVIVAVVGEFVVEEEVVVMVTRIKHFAPVV
jgi:hypothetical protein